MHLGARHAPEELFNASKHPTAAIYTSRTCILRRGKMNVSFLSAVFMIVFWLLVGAVVVSAIISDSRRRRDALDIVKLAIERGQPLDPALIEKLIGRGHVPRLNSTSLMVSSIICLSAGIGGVIFAFCLGTYKAIIPMCGLGIIVICIGIGLRIAAKYVRRNQQHNPSQGSDA
jgi:hypothetical protein